MELRDLRWKKTKKIGEKKKKIRDKKNERMQMEEMSNEMNKDLTKIMN